MINSLIPYNYSRITDINPFIYDNNLYTLEHLKPESPETAIARRTPYEASDLLKKLSEDRVNEKAMDSAAFITHDYLSSLSQKRLDETSGIHVSFERKKRFFSKENNGFDLSINLKF